MNVRPTDFSEAEVCDLVAFHLRGMHDNSPPGTNYALGVEALRQPDILGFAAWDGASLLGIGAVRDCADFAEVKSMRTSPDGLDRGVGAAILRRIEQAMTQKGIRHLKLETGFGPEFEAAHSFYQKHGFSRCEAFGDYVETDFNTFYEKRL